jgi:hypothetical protein
MKIDELIRGRIQHFNMPDKNNDIAISVKTEAEYQYVCLYLLMLGFRWTSGKNFNAKMDFFYNYKENTLIFPLSGKYGSKSPPGVSVYTYDELFSKENRKIKKIKLLDIL